MRIASAHRVRRHLLLAAVFGGSFATWSENTLAQLPAPLVVTGEWLAGHLTTPHQVIIHAVASKAEYDAGHIPGARMLVSSSYAVTRDGLSSQLPPVATLDSIVESLGVNDGDRVVIYGQPLPVARLLVTLEYLGLKGKVSVLDGGIDAWREAARPVTTDTVQPTTGTFTPAVDASIIADVAYVQGAADRKGVRILDARAPEFYLGTSAGTMPRAGHIPGARNVPFSSLTTELTLQREQGKVARLFAQAGVAKGDTVVTYCHIGMQGSLLYLAARRLGFNARLYDGSFEEWSKRSELPVVVGKE